MCVRNKIGKFVIAIGRVMSKILHRPWWLLSKRQLEPLATPRFNVGVISNRLTWSELTTQHWNKGVRGGLCLAMAVNLMIKKKNFEPDSQQEKTSLISELLSLESKCTLLVTPTSTTQHRSKQNNESLLHASSTTCACHWCKVFTFNSSPKNL